MCHYLMWKSESDFSIRQGKAVCKPWVGAGQPETMPRWPSEPINIWP